MCSKYIFAGGTRIALKTVSDTLYYHQDHLGSSSVVTNARAELVEEIHYLPFGAAFSDTGAVSVNHKYTSQEFDAETGLYYYNARYYNPVLGRFISADTIVPYPANPQSLNRYSYVLNNPLLYTDPTGHHFKKWLRRLKENPKKILGAVMIAAAIAIPFTTWIPETINFLGMTIEAANWQASAILFATGIPMVSKNATVNIELPGITIPLEGGGGGSGSGGGGIPGGSGGGGGIHEPVDSSGSGSAYNRLTPAEIEFIYQYTNNLLNGNQTNFVQSIGMIFINGIVLSNPAVLFALNQLSAALSYPAYINVSGGDRYRDADCYIRSSSNNKIVKGSDLDTTHLAKLAVDFYVVNFTPPTQFLLQFFDYIKRDYADGHIHGDLRNHGAYCVTCGGGR